jgi:dynein heavy chain
LKYFLSEVKEKRQRYVNGLEKLGTTAITIVEMKRKLIDELQPELIASGEKIEQMVIVMEKESVKMAKVEAVVKQEELIAEEQAKEAERIKFDCKKALEEVTPLYNQALSALDTITPQVKNIF